MIERPLEHVRKMQELISEIKLHISDKKKFHETLRMIDTSYQRGQFGFFRYQQLRHRLLKGKSKREWDAYFDSYIFSILKQIEFLNSRIFYDVFTDRTDLKLKIPRKLVKRRPLPAIVALPKPVVAPLDEEIKPLIIRRVRKVGKGKKEKQKREEEGLTKPLDLSGAEHVVSPEDVGKGVSAGQLKPPQEDVIEAEVVGEVPASGDAGLAADIDSEPLVEVEAEMARDIPRDERPAPEKVEEEGRKTLARVLFGASGEKEGREKKSSFLDSLFGRSKKKEVLPWLEEEDRSFWKSLKNLFSPKKSVLDEISGDSDEKESTLEFKDIFSMKFIKNLLSRKRATEFISSKTEISPSIIALKRYKMKELEKEGEESRLDTSLLLQEAKRIKSIINRRRRFTVYEHSTIGAIANIMVKRISLFMIESFPDFFKQIYDNLRLADIKMLSNTYVNLMLLASIVSFFISYSVSAVVMFLRDVPLILILLRSLVVGSLFSGITFLIFYLYPSMRIKQRRRSINANLPFAINHMSAVASSGVPPEAMFRLIADSKEYEEISVEIEKISEYIDIFGYDILTAVKSVAATTPSDSLREFFEGLVSTVESGGDLKHYLEQKAEEAMLQYKLERQKYVETISTYSDIYTGLLIAAPLFFVVALSLVSMLGGKVAGMDVNSLIAMGTYFVIPLLNLAFIVFLEITQPEV